MTVSSLIEIVDLKEPNSITNGEKIAWLSDLDGKIFEEVIKTHEGQDPETDTFTPYSEGTEDLLIDDPYAQGIYVNYLIAMIADPERYSYEELEAIGEGIEVRTTALAVKADPDPDLNWSVLGLARG